MAPLLCLSHRYYDPATGRFVNRDPIGYDGGINLYTFAEGNPVNKIDPDGTIPLETFLDIASIGYSIYGLATDPSWENAGYLAWDVAATAIPYVPGSYVAKAGKIATKGIGEGKSWWRIGSNNQLKYAGLKDNHHIQDAAVRDLPGYSYGRAPNVRLDGPSSNASTPHGITRITQKQRGGGTYGAERRIGYKALREAGVSKGAARGMIRKADRYFNSIGVDANTTTRIPLDRH